jgi:hypothetical protein
MHFQARSWWLTAALFLLLGFGPNFGAQATGMAGAYERVLFYNIYQAAVLTWGKDQDKFFPNGITIKGKTSTCVGGTHRNGGCNFIEFVQQLDQMPVKDDVITDDLDLDNPDPHKAAYAIRSDGRHTGTFQLGRLVSEALRAKVSNRRWRQATAELAHDYPARISGWPSPRRERTSFNQEHQQPTGCPEGGEILCSSISPIQCAVVCAVVQQKGPELNYGDTAKYARDVFKQGKAPTDPSPRPVRFQC